MATFNLINTVIVGTVKFLPGSLINDAVQDKPAIVAAGGVMFATGNAIIDTAAAKARSMHINRGSNEVELGSIMTSAVQLAQATTVMASLPVYSNATRPAANSVTPGFMIFNSSDAAPNISDGTDWRDMNGVITT